MSPFAELRVGPLLLATIVSRREAGFQQVRNRTGDSSIPCALGKRDWASFAGDTSVARRASGHTGRADQNHGSLLLY